MCPLVPFCPGRTATLSLRPWSVLPCLGHHLGHHSLASCRISWCQPLPLYVNSILQRRFIFPDTFFSPHYSLSSLPETLSPVQYGEQLHGVFDECSLFHTRSGMGHLIILPLILFTFCPSVTTLGGIFLASVSYCGQLNILHGYMTTGRAYMIGFGDFNTSYHRSYPSI